MTTAIASILPADIQTATRLLKDKAGLSVGQYKLDKLARAVVQKTARSGAASIGDYLAMLGAPGCPADLMSDFINEFTINHTAFFREPGHFPLMVNFLQSRQSPLSIWSCACSTGEEVYSIAMACDQAFGAARAAGINILATDIDTRALQYARKGLYPIARIDPVSESLRREYFLRGTGENDGSVRIKPSIAERVHFDHLNLVNFSISQVAKQDVIFCRNILIYFDPQTIEKILRKFALVLKPGGLLITGHSEQLTQFRHLFTPTGNTTFVATTGNIET